MIVIPMAGLSSRFFKAGFTKPKYQLELWGRPMFDWVLQTFRTYFETEKFVFIVRADYETPQFVAERCETAGISDFEVVVLDTETSGQAETVLLGMEEITAEGPLIIFNADSFHLGFEIPDLQGVDATLDVFKDQGEHWSFVEPGPDHSVLRTTEKIRISDLCSDGMYIFADYEIFRETYNSLIDAVIKQTGEAYIAPLYNALIEAGKTVTYRVIDRESLYFCGTPEEYATLKQLPVPVKI